MNKGQEILEKTYNVVLSKKGGNYWNQPAIQRLHASGSLADHRHTVEVAVNLCYILDHMQEQIEELHGTIDRLETKLAREQQHAAKHDTNSTIQSPSDSIPLSVSE